ncbi:hypothetical protein K7472_00280 [Streptomyces sp. PTM05]|uniref:Integral membrane protein n=1 Tax=Streptantibioticus parmotrematis TaxID=2873249 RepID=A0ABS7QJE9_9ACTN|nr:hypothetical protein [Streptantibioticus parmotrematis]MBY8883282.1 hypothetical protein [Streptantibioticus parmotrematis]
MTGATRVMTAAALATLVLVTAYTVVVGDSGWLWLGWATLAVLAGGTALVGSR